ncbi:MAG TPA: hypothetical protein VFY17_05045, partial [Pilimelia sp.]|nr:hypothetical protein [Pilimelia sp.]
MRRRMRSAAGRTAAYLFAGHAVVVVASLVLNVLSAHALGPAGRGELALLLQVAYLLGVCAVAGVDRAYPAATPAAGRAAEREVRRLLAPGVGALVAAAAGGAALTAAARGPAAAYPLLVGLMAVAVVGLTAVRTGAAAAGTGRRYLGANLASQGLLVAGALALTAAGQDRATAWLALYAAAPLLVVAVLWVRRPAAAPAAAVARLRRVRAEGRRILP